MKGKTETFWSDEFKLFVAIQKDSNGDQVGNAGYGISRKEARADWRYQNNEG